LTILTHEWTSLYERASTVTDAILRKVEEVMNSNTISATPFQIPEHLMKTLSDTNPVIVNIRLKYVKPVFNQMTGQKRGFIVTQHASPVVLSGDDTFAVNMLRH